MVQLPDDPEHPDIFQLNNPDKGRPQAGHKAPALSLPPLLLLDGHLEALGALRLLFPFALGLDVTCYPLTGP